MKDNKKINETVNWLRGSNVPFILVRRDDEQGKHANRVDMYGMYPDVKACMISAMVRLGRVIMESGYDELTTAGELQNISLQAVSKLLGSKKEKDEEKHS